jgi:hypothetical protein
MNWEKMTRKELLALPYNGDETNKYDCLLIVPDYKLHESGYKYIAIIGLNYDDSNKEIEQEIVAYCDDLWMNEDTFFKPKKSQFHIDCSPKGIFRIHSALGKFCLPMRVSTTYVHIEGIKK